MTATYLDLKSELVRYCSYNRPKNTAAVTLTFKQGLFVGGYWVRLDEYHCRKNLRHFLNKLNKRVFGNGVRNGKRLWCMPVLEGCAHCQWHYHLDLEIPPGWRLELFRATIFALWADTDWGGVEIDIKPADEGWITYMLKPRTKADYLDSIDWNNASKAT